jgi:hypothetical protein
VHGFELRLQRLGAHIGMIGVVHPVDLLSTTQYEQQQPKET